MRYKLHLFFSLTLLKCTLSLRLNNHLSKNNYLAEKYLRKPSDDQNSKLKIIESLETLIEEFTNDINTAKSIIRGTFLDTEASLKEISNDVVKNISKFSFAIDEKLNVLDGLFQEFIEDSKSAIFKLSEKRLISQKVKIKEIVDSILYKMKRLKELSIVNKYQAILKFGNTSTKNEALEEIKNEQNISVTLKEELFKYKTLRDEDIKESELINFLSSLYYKFTNMLDKIIEELSNDLSKSLS